MKIKSKLIVLAVAGLVLSSILVGGILSVEAMDHPWPHHGQNLRGTRRSEYDTSHVDGTLRWETNVPYQLKSPVVDSAGNVYVSSSYLFAFNPEGERLWNFTADLSVSSSPSLGPDGTVYVGGSDGILYAVDPITGEEKWRFDAGSTIRSNPTICSRHIIYFGTDDGVLYSLNGLTRTVEWNYTIPEGDERTDIVTSPAIADDGTVYFGSLDYHLYALDSDGNFKWNLFTGEQVWSSPAIGDDGTVYFGFIEGLYAVNPDGTRRWIYTVKDLDGDIRGVRSSPAIGEDGTIYFGAMDNSTYALYQDGSLKWNFMTDSYIFSSSPAIGDDGTIYFGSMDTVFYAIQEEEDHIFLKWYYNTTTGIDSSPAIGPDGTVYVGNNHGNLYAFTGSEDETDINWYIVGAVVGIAVAVTVYFVFKKEPKS